MRKGADEPGPLTAGAAGAADAEADEAAAGAALVAVGALGAEALELEADVALDAVEPPLSLGGSTATPPLPPFAAVAAVEPVEEPPLVAGALLVEPPAACADGAAALDAPLEDAGEDAGEDDVEGDVAEGVAAEGAALCVVALCAAGVLVRVLCPTGKNEPPVMSVAMMPAITTTRAMPISRSGQLRRSQSMVPF
jgi:hypothetical protein